MPPPAHDQQQVQSTMAVVWQVELKVWLAPTVRCGLVTLAHMKTLAWAACDKPCMIRVLVPAKCVSRDRPRLQALELERRALDTHACEISPPCDPRTDCVRMIIPRFRQQRFTSSTSVARLSVCCLLLFLPLSVVSGGKTLFRNSRL